jgi:retron-type reverse transcriptase
VEANLLDLLDRIKSGRYKAPPVRRTYIPKADGSRRPLGIPTPPANCTPFQPTFGIG